MPLEDLITLLGDPRPAVAHRAIESLAQAAGTDDALSRLGEIALSHQSPALRRNAVWALARINHRSARALVCAFLSDPDEIVRQAAIHTAGLWRDDFCVLRLIELLSAPSPHNRLAAAVALGRIGAKIAVPALLQAAGEPADRQLEHALTYALIEIADPAGTAAALKSNNARVLRTAMVALDQMDGGGLDPQLVARLLASAQPILKETSSWIVGRHHDWAPALAGVLGERLIRADLPATERSDLERQLGKFAQSAPIQELLVARLRDPSVSPAARRSCLEAMSASGLKENQVPSAWIKALTNLLDGDRSSAELIPLAVATIRALPLTRETAGKLLGRLLAIAGDDRNSPELRLNALAAVPRGLANIDEGVFAFLLRPTEPEQTVAMRTTAADVLARAKLTQLQLTRLADALCTAGPVEVDRLLSAFEQSTDESVGLKLLNVLGQASAFSSLRVDSLKAHLAKYGPAVQKQAEALFARINVDAAKQKARLEQLTTILSAGNVRRGQLVFHSEKAACFTCHAIGYRGGTVGPDLTKIGAVRAERDLLEAIIFPSASLVRSFEPIAVATSDGKVYNGLLRGETADELLLTTGVNQEARIVRRDIEEIRPSTVSIMPAGLDQQLTHQELADLVAFLRQCK
jgi:putative heme-binding domain-containing protein